MVTSYARGHDIYFNTESEQWKFTDTDEVVRETTNDRTCKCCGKLPTESGADACIGYVEGYSSLCCGHGIEKPYAVLNNGVRIQFQTKEEMVKYFAKLNK